MNFSHFFSQLFTDLTTEDSILVLVILLGAFLIGLIAGVLAGRSGVGRLRRELRDKEQQRLVMQAEKQAVEEQLELQEADLQRAENEWREQRERSERLEEEKAELQNDLLQANEQISRLQAKINADSALMEDMHHQILGLKAKAGRLSSAPENASGEEAASLPAGLMEELNGRLDKLETENQELRRRQEQMAGSPQGGEADLAALQDMEEKLDRLEREHAGLRSLGDKLRRLEQENASLKAVAVKLQKLESEHAQLQQLQEKLAALERSGKGPTPAAPHGGETEPGLRVFKDPLDLKIIEGVDSRTEKVLKSAGIQNWMDLSRTPMEELHRILRAAGGEPATLDPATWAEQARLATEGRWRELQEYQNYLQDEGGDAEKNSAD